MAFLGVQCLLVSTSGKMPKLFRELFNSLRVCAWHQVERSSRDMTKGNLPDDLRRKPNLPPKPGLTGPKSIDRFG